MWPYLTFSLIQLVFVFTKELARLILINSFNYSDLLYIVIETITLWGDGPLWFLPTLFVADIIFVCLNKRCKNKQEFIFIILTVIGCILGAYCEQFYNSYLDRTAPLNSYILAMIARTFVAYSYIFIGSKINILVEKLSNTDKTLKIAISIIGIVLCCWLCQYFRILDLHFGYTRNPLVSYLIAIIFTISLMMIFSICKESKILEYLSNNSLTIMALNNYLWIVVRVYKLLINKLNIQSISIYSDLVSCLIIFFIGTFVIIKIINYKFKWIIVCPEIFRDIKF